MTATLGAGDRRALMIGVVSVALLLGYAHVLRPAIGSLREQRRALDDARSVLAREQGLVAAAPRLPDAQRNAQRALAQATARMLEGDSVRATAELSELVGRLAKGAGVRVGSAEGRAPVRSHGLVRLAVEVRGEASWGQLLAFIHSLESARQLLDVNAVRVERGAQGAGSIPGAAVSYSAVIAGYARAGGQ